MSQRKLYLIDASIYIFRAWFSLPDSILDNEGNPVNAVYGYAYFLCQLLEKTNPSHIVAAFDASLNSSFRNKIYPDYKANRESAPDDLKYQFELCRKLTKVLGISSFSSKRYEADDLIGTLATRMRKNDFKNIFITTDKDLSQLVKKGDTFWNYAKDERHSYASCKKVFGVKPEQMIDFLAMAGDSIDNIPGVPGIGRKTAIVLLEKHGSLRLIYKNLNKIKASKIRGAQRIYDLLKEHQQLALISQQLATIVCDAPVKAGVRSLAYTPPTAMRINRFCTQYGLGEKLRQRLLSLAISS
ncbi:MAG: flap endonuclease [Sulfuriflexus sp.]|nr:flap endonuclease [Sulfuriflexus sp.]